MSYRHDRTAQLREAIKHGRFASVAQLRAAGTPTAQHNVEAKVEKAVKNDPTPKTSVQDANLSNAGKHAADVKK